MDKDVGILYVTTTIVPGLVKIGITKNFNNRMDELERNGYCNITGLKRHFAIEVDNYKEKEVIVQNIFANNRVGKTELFALDANVVIKLFTTMSDKIVYPQNVTEKEVLEEIKETEDSRVIPDGIYKLNVSNFRAVIEIQDGEWIIKKGSTIDLSKSCPTKKAMEKRLSIETNNDGMVLDDCNIGICTPSDAGIVVLGRRCNGWTDWKNNKGESVDIYRK